MDNILETIDHAGTFRTFLAGLCDTQLETLLASSGPWTVLAVPDDAFALLPAGAVEDLLDPRNRAALLAVVGNHVASGRWTLARLIRAGGIQTQHGSWLSCMVHRNVVHLGRARTIRGDLVCTNGLIHVIDRVIVPHEALCSGCFGPAEACGKDRGRSGSAIESHPKGETP